jgi:uncharacterized membrane protein YgdD (TMEM256/DUF423 family)
MKAKDLWTSATLLMALSVMLGAFAAHGLKSKVSAYHVDVFQKGVTYQFIHAAALLVLAIGYDVLNTKRARVAVILFLLGILFFSGSLYALGGLGLVPGNGLLKLVGPITPIGGLCFIAGWVVLAFSYKGKQ